MTRPRPHLQNMEAAAVKANRALELRMSGASYAQVAEAVGYSDRGAAHHAVERAIKHDYSRTAEMRDEFVMLTLARTERLIRAHWVNAVHGQEKATAIIVALIDRQVRLLGLEPPRTIEVTQSEARETAHQLLAGFEEEFNRLRARATLAEQEARRLRVEALQGPEGNGDDSDPFTE